MKAILTVLALLLLAPAVAIAHRRTVAPPGNSGVNQYVEVVPTAGGGRPSATLGAGGGGGSGGSGGSRGFTALSPATRRALSRKGALGRSLETFAAATAPASVGRPAGSGRSSGAGGGSRSGGSAGKAPAAAASKASVAAIAPLSTLERAITGSSASGGLGGLLPVIFGIVVVGAAGLALRRRRAG